MTTVEHERLAGPDAPAWRRWGPYLAERAWGSVREDYSANGDAWAALSHDDARSTAYRWNEDGMGGVCDEEQILCLAPVLWNGVDPILKERMFGLTNTGGNHGEDVKERYWYEDATPSGSWLVWRYHYPIGRFPYEELAGENARRTRDEPEYEIDDTGCFAGGFFDVRLRVAKDAPCSLTWELSVTNTSAGRAGIDVLPTLWFRNTWSWGRDPTRPSLCLDGSTIRVHHAKLGAYRLAFEGAPEALFCDNESNLALRYGDGEGCAYPKDGINDHVVTGAASVNPAGVGTKAALRYHLDLGPGETGTVRVHLAPAGTPVPDAGAVLAAAEADADTFYAELGAGVDDCEARIVRQAAAGLVWGKCFYHYNVRRWIDGDPAQPKPPPGRGEIRNGAWGHLDVREVLSMPDAWEYPWFAAWDLAFHAVALAHIDPEFAKDQLLVLTREWYMAPNGQLPAYEWNFSDVNPPVHAWAALEVFHITGGTDHRFLARMFHKLVMNFTWWVNRVDSRGRNLFEGGFLGMDNVGPFNRSHRPPVAATLEQSDATAWMAMYCLDLLQMALRLARTDPAYEDMAVKFFNHFVTIAGAMNDNLWDATDGFYYDVLRMEDGTAVPVQVRSIAGLVALAAVRRIPAAALDELPEFAERVRWFLSHRAESSAQAVTVADDGTLLLSVVSPEKLAVLARTLFAEDEFLSPFGIRSVSKAHGAAPYSAWVGDVHLGSVTYEPGESTSGLFGGNSNWRGPIWMPVNHLIVTGLRRFASFLGDDTHVRVPTGDGRELTLAAAGDELAERLVSLLRPGADGTVPAAAGRDWPEGLLLFHEYFHGETGEGLGAAHQTGWTALIADLVLRRNRDVL